MLKKKKLKKKKKKTSLNHEIKHRYKFILKKLINLEKKLPGFGPNNICGNKGLIEDYSKYVDILVAFDELGIYDATFKHFKINRDLDDPSLEAWDGFVKKNGDKLFNILNFIMPLKKDFYEFIIKDKNKQEKEVKTDLQGNFIAYIILAGIFVLCVFLLKWCMTGDTSTYNKGSDYQKRKLIDEYFDKGGDGNYYPKKEKFYD